MNIKHKICAGVAGLTLGIAAQQADASALDILDLGWQTSGPFQYNAFHTAETNGGMSGTVLAWFAIGRGDTGYWDPVTGDFQLSVHLFDDSGLSANAGTAFASGNLSYAEFNGYDGGLIGTITWDFSKATNSVLASLGTATIKLLDFNYATSSTGLTANSLDANTMTLWGAEGEYDPLTGLFDTATTTIGMDMVALFATDPKPVPVPAAVWLFGSGLLGLAAIGRRRQDGFKQCTGEYGERVPG